MFNPFRYPFLILVLSLSAFWISARIGVSLRKKQREREDVGHDDFDILVGASLTLLALIVAFTFSMAVSRYDQRKNLEEEEANAIGTECLRAHLLPADDAMRVRALLKSYIDHRVLRYKTRDEEQLRQIDHQTAQLQTEMWSVVETRAAAQPTAVTALILAGMNDVLNSEGYAQAARLNRIPIGAWTLLVLISIFCNFLIGYRSRARSAFLLLILPLALSISILLIADIDSPRRGVIRVRPQNLERLAESLHSQ
jgi:hypothetical protein